MSVTKNQYRYDLDGLRGIAIALVVIFHVYVGRVSGGVDVFLLLSGFFFIGAQYRNAINPRQSINPWWSIWRTLRRLIPTLVLILAVTAAVVIAFVPVLRTSENAAQLKASLLYYQNFELANQGAAYAAADRDTSPLQHLWSMSVQGQFYLGAIVLISLLAWMTRSREILGKVSSVNEAKRTDATRGKLYVVLVSLITLITAASAAYAFYMHGQDQALNYYSTLTRLWELGLGALLGLILMRRPLGLPRFGAQALAIAGFALVFSTGFIFDGAAQFPGPWTLWPLGGAALIILAGPNAGFVSKFLASRPLRSVGQSAYALYLWHWPLLILATHIFRQKEPSVALGTSVIVVSFALAWLTNRYVEIPLAQKSRRPTRTQAVFTQSWDALRTNAATQRRGFAAGVIALVVASLFALLPYQQSRIDAALDGKLDPSVYPGALALTDGAEVPWASPKPDKDYIRDLWPEPALDGCLAVSGEDVGYFVPNKRWREESEPCIYGDVTAEKSMLIIGGSHIEHWFAPINEYAKKNGYRLDVILRQGCPATLSPIVGVGEICADWTQRALERIDQLQPEVVFTTATRPGFQDEPAHSGDYVPQGYIDFFDAMEELAIEFVGIRDTPWALRENFDLFSPTSCTEEEDCTIVRERTLSAVNPAEEALSAYEHGHSIDFSNIFCDDQTCRKVIGNIYVYRDSNHITNELALNFAPELERRLDAFLK